MSPDLSDDPTLARENELREAMLANDARTLDRLLDDALVFTALDAHRARRLRLTRLAPSDRCIVRCGQQQS